MFGVSRLPRCSQGILGNVIFPFIAEWTIGQATHDINQEKINEYVICLHILVYLCDCYYHWHYFQLSNYPSS